MTTYKTQREAQEALAGYGLLPAHIEVVADDLFIIVEGEE